MRINMIVLTLMACSFLFSQENNQEQIQKSVKVEFTYGSQVVSSRYDESIKEFADFLKQNPELSVVVEGHSDYAGEEELNYETSVRRAKAIYHFLVKQGIDPKRLEYKGYSSDQAVTKSPLEPERFKNRRAQTVLKVRRQPLLLDRQSSLNLRYSLLNRESDDKEIDSNFVNASYIHWISHKWALIGLGGLITSQFNSNNVNSDIKGWLVGFGGLYDFGSGLSLSSSLYFQKDKSDFAVQNSGTLTATSDSERFGLSVNIAKVFILSAKWSLMTSLGLSVGQTQLDLINTSKSESLFRASARLGGQYLISRHFKASGFIASENSDQRITISNKKSFLRAGLGIHYLIKDISYYLKYHKEFASNQDAYMLTIGTSRRF